MISPVKVGAPPVVTMETAESVLIFLQASIASTHTSLVSHVATIP